MINLLLGASGAGKSYEACVYHILPALQRGRKVITNLPLDLDRWAALDPAYLSLIEIRNKPQQIRGTWEPTREEGAYNVRSVDSWMPPEPLARCFAGVWDYYDEWRHEQTKVGALFVIDEAQNVIPKSGCSVAVEEWVALHRHWRCDVIYVTQSYGKLSQAIRENVQMVYRLRKMVAWGKPDNYIRKVQDGLRGEVLNEGQRKYEKRYFGLYRSHTQGESGSETMADDVRPWWKHWTFTGAFVMLCLSVLIFTLGDHGNPLKPKVAQAKPVQAVVQVVPQSVGEVAAEKSVPKEPEKEPEPQAHPFNGRTLHVVGSYSTARKTKGYLFEVAQNGQHVSDVTSDELVTLGYRVEGVTDCAVKIGFEKWSNWLICDAPQVAIIKSSDGVSSGSRIEEKNGV